MEKAYFDARTFGWSRRPIVEMVIPSTLDGTLAPRGQHVVCLFCQHVAPKLSDGSSWDDHRETVVAQRQEVRNRALDDPQSMHGNIVHNPRLAAEAG
jgi:phytoene dehydrogenase-like protein